MTDDRRPVQARGLVKRYGELVAVAGVDLTVAAGEVRLEDQVAAGQYDGIFFDEASSSETLLPYYRVLARQLVAPEKNLRSDFGVDIKVIAVAKGKNFSKFIFSKREAKVSGGAS